MSEPLVSIIIPLYNSEKYIAETISSALNQTWPNKEVIIVDDGSTDNSLFIAKSFESYIVKIFSQPNKGASAARNRGIKEAKGDYIQFLDADDLLSPGKIAEQVDGLRNSPDKIAVCGIIKFKDGSDYSTLEPSPRDEPFIYSTDDPVDFLVDLYGGYKRRGAMIALHAWLVPVEIVRKVGPWNEQLTVDDDGEFFCRVVLASNGIVRTKGLSYYRRFMIGGQNLSARTDKKSIQSMIDSFHLKKKYLLEHTQAAAAYFALYKQTLNLAIRTYLLQPDLYRGINKELRDYPSYDYIPIMGGNFINFITKVFGWRTSRIIQYYSAQLRPRK